MHIESLESRRLCSGSPLTTLSAMPYRQASGVDSAGRTVSASLIKKARELRVTRTLADGQRDPSFGQNGRSTIANVPIYGDVPLIGLNTFKIVFDHRDRPLILTQTTLYRLTTDGRSDRLFDRDGRVDVPIVQAASDVAIDARNRPVIAGTSQGKTGMRGTVLRIGERGELDRGFGASGSYKRAVPIDKNYQQPGNSTATNLTVLPDGDILAAGGIEYRKYAATYKNNHFTGLAVWRMNADGSLDTAYGKSGTASYGHLYLRGINQWTDRVAAFTADGGVRAISTHRDAGNRFTDYEIDISSAGVVADERQV